MINLKERQKTTLVAGVIGLAVGVGIGSSLPWYGSEQECMVREAKGMPRDSQYLVRGYCREKFRSSNYEAPAAEAPAAEAAPAPEAAPYPLP
jgi:hypothetical protein